MSISKFKRIFLCYFSNTVKSIFSYIRAILKRGNLLKLVPEKVKLPSKKQLDAPTGAGNPCEKSN
jgi:hypothetical protein